MIVAASSQLAANGSLGQHDVDYDIRILVLATAMVGVQMAFQRIDTAGVKTSGLGAAGYPASARVPYTF